jgi:transketolase
MRNAFIHALENEARSNDRIDLIVGDLGYGVIETFESEFPDRFINAGIAEQAMIGMAAGLASRGRIPVVYSIANFPTFRCLEQIRNDICYHKRQVIIVSVGAGFAYGTLGYTHHGVEDISITRSLPGLDVFTPSDQLEAVGALKYALESEGPTYIRLAKTGEPTLHKQVPDFRSSSAICLRPGEDLLLLSTGAITASVMQVAQDLSELGFFPEVWSVTRVSPLELDLEKIKRFKMIVTVEEHRLAGGFGSAVLEYLNDKSHHTRLLRIGIEDNQYGFAGSTDFMKKKFGLDRHTMREVLTRALSIRDPG